MKKIIIKANKTVKLRGDWGNVKPFTRVHETDKNKAINQRKAKHKKDLKYEEPTI